MVNEAISLAGGEFKIVVCDHQKVLGSVFFGVAGQSMKENPAAGRKVRIDPLFFLICLLFAIKGAHQSANWKGKKRTISWQLFPPVQRQAFNRLPVERCM